MPTMTRVCCVCRKRLGTTPCVPEQDGKETSGYCPRCLRETYLAWGFPVPDRVHARAKAEEKA